MTTDLWMLTASAALTWAMLIGGGFPYALTRGWSWIFGPREDPPDPRGWFGRANRATKNMYENLPLFTVLVLVATVSGRANGVTALGSEVFFLARVAYAVCYVAAIPYLRTLAWASSVVGMILIGVQLFR